MASDSHNDLHVMTESVVFDDASSDLNSAILSVLPNNNPHNSSSLLTIQPDSIHQNQVIECNNNQYFQDLLEEIRNVHNNHITDSTRLQYLYANSSIIVIYLFKNYHHVILQPYADKYKEWYENESSHIFAKKSQGLLKNVQYLSI